jgi:serine/threonine protein kinase
MADRPTTSDTTQTDRTPALPTIPGYQILEEIGRGGMGVVYKAFQKDQNRFIAIKLIRDGALAGPQERARFRLEAAAASRVQHPNVVRIHEVGEHQGQLYFTMEFIEGGSLDRHLAHQLPTPSEAAEYARTLALTIQHAHNQKVIHRDLKPGNILISKDGLKVTDFGLAKRLDSDSTAWTQDGAILGTAGYMAPEQAAGRIDEVGPSIDIYALGAILYEMLTGKPPFRADNWHQILQQVLHNDPLPPSRLKADLPADLETICLKCLEKSPAHRYASARELAQDLGRFLDREPVVAVPVSERDILHRQAARDGFQIVAEISRNSRSVVYRALSGSMQQPVALKVFAKGICHRDEWEVCLGRASQWWLVLAHPQLVLIQKGGWWDGLPYQAMEYVPRGSLADSRSDSPTSLRETLKLVEQVAEVVCYLHRQGVVHGNLKPANVLLAADGIPRIADFYDPSLPCREAKEIGYLAPELVENAEPRPHTDIYGLGLVLYELLTGRPPFTASTAQEMREQVMQEEPAPPSRFRADISPALDVFCLRCLRKDPWRRYFRAYDVLTRLQLFQQYPDGEYPSEYRGHSRK